MNSPHMSEISASGRLGEPTGDICVAARAANLNVLRATEAFSSSRELTQVGCCGLRSSVVHRPSVDLDAPEKTEREL